MVRMALTSTESVTGWTLPSVKSGFAASRPWLSVVSHFALCLPLGLLMVWHAVLLCRRVTSKPVLLRSVASI